MNEKISKAKTKTQLLENLELIQVCWGFTKDKFGSTICKKGRGVFGNYLNGVTDVPVEVLVLVSEASKVSIDDLVKKKLTVDDVPDYPNGPPKNRLNSFVHHYDPEKSMTLFAIEKELLSLMDRTKELERMMNEKLNK